MSKSLIIAEKKSVAELIAKALGGMQDKNGYWEGESIIVAPAQGHLIRQSFSSASTNVWNMDTLPILPSKFNLEVIERSAQVYNTLAKLIGRSDVSTLVNACDSGREGELIFRLIYDYSKTTKPTQRMWFPSIDLESIKEAYKNRKPGHFYDNLGASAYSRAEADWLIGINATRAMSVLYSKVTGLSGGANLNNLGRVLSPALAITVYREREILTFKSKDFWQIKAKFKNSNGVYESIWVTDPKNEDIENSNRFFDKSKAEEILNKCKTGKVTSAKDEIENVSVKPPQLFDTTDLQYEANKKFKMPVAKVDDIAQNLYLKGIITYPRTDANVLSLAEVNVAKANLIKLQENIQYKELSKYITDNSLVDHNTSNKLLFNNELVRDHFAVIPTGNPIDGLGLTSEEKTIYDMIVRRFIAAFYPPAQYQKTTRLTTIESETFKVTGRVLKEKGWLAVYGDDQSSTKDLICALTDELPVTDEVYLHSGKTKPPKRYTQGTLVKAMEKAGQFIEEDEKELRAVLKVAGLGRPQGRARIVETLLSNSTSNGTYKEPFLNEEKNELVPTVKGMDCIAKLENSEIEVLVSPKMTGDWEQKLLDMEDGKYSREKFMDEVRSLTSEIISKFKNVYEATPERKVNANCPQCNTQLSIDGTKFECSNCAWSLWGEIAGKKLKLNEVEDLINKGKTDLITGFFSPKHERHFDAFLTYDKETNKIAFDFPPPDTLEVPCPKCKKNGLISSERTVRCKDKECGFTIWREIARKKLSDNQIKEMISKGITKPIKGFKGRSDKSFEAQVKLNMETLKTEFVFTEKKQAAKS